MTQSSLDLREGVAVVPQESGFTHLVGPDIAVAVDEEVLRVVRGESTLSKPFREGVAAALGCLGLLDGIVPAEPIRPEAPASDMTVGIVIPNLNGGDLLRRTLQSVERQTHRSFEVLVVDGGSVDDSRAITADAGGRWVDVAPGTGFAAACNAGARGLETDFLLILNNDADLEADFLAQILHVAATGGASTAAVAPMVRRGDHRAVVESLGNVLGTRGFGAGRLAGLIDIGQITASEKLFGAPFTAALLRRVVWDAIGPMDERFDFYYEDVEWCTRARLAGYEVLSAPRAVVYHEGSASLGADLSPRKLEMVTRNRVLWAMSSLRVKTVVRYGGSYAREDAIRVARSIRNGELDDAVSVLRAWGGVASRVGATRRQRASTLEGHVLTMTDLLGLAISPMPFYDSTGAILLTESIVRSWYVAAAVHPR
jgi:GT2 family glycosyltransferase